MGKQRNKTATKENSVEDVKKDELQQNSEETIEETGGETQEPAGETGEQGSVGDQGASDDDGEGSEEPPASGAEDEAGVDGSGADEGDTTDSDVADAAEPAAPAVEPAITTLTQLNDAAPAPQVKAEPTSAQADALIAYIQEYVVKMDPAKYQDAKSGVPHQKRLYTLISELSKLEFLDFKVGMDKLLKLIFDYRHAAFSDLYSRRFFENLYPSLTHDQVREFDDLLSILVTVGSATNRSRAMTQVDLSAALKSVKHPKAQQNLSAYFSALR